MKKLRLFLFDILPMVSIVIGVICVIMFGVATPSESAAFGCLGVVLLAALYRSLTWAGIVKCRHGRAEGH